MEKYQMGEVIGRGAHGVVHRGLDLKTNQTVAIKKTHSKHYKYGIPSTTIRQISLLKEMEHDNIVKLLDVISNINNECYIIFELLDLDLKKFMEIYPEESMDKHRIKNFLRQILSGVSYCHKRRILHRDLKPSNLLLDLNGYRVKIADFEWAKKFDIPFGGHTPEVVTLSYRPPEILLGSPVYSTPVDVWSVGCIFAEMAMRRPLFDGRSKIGQLTKIFRIMGKPNEKTWPGVSSLPYYQTYFPKWIPKNLVEFVPNLELAGVDLLSEMLCLDPARRISAHDALEHAYFNDDYDDVH
ncbi:cell division control protein 2 homolog [Camellia sinensis]|uniref:cell division control protein 2 homolog n=1 Tax=Camellia sinensis TaxID=4442 RepID=UPI001035B82E|nr:cell division control protein 2 homolog [Camellia sinensis]